MAKIQAQISDSFERTDEDFSYEISFKRWLVYEIETKKMTVIEAVKRFKITERLISYWRKKLAGEFVLSLPEMSIEEKQAIDLLQKKVKELEKQLEIASMKLIAVNTLIDVAEEKLKIKIRKKPGAKQ